ncbi:MAG: glycosyl hydrolase family 8 [Candidatus Woesebacteria bacterium]
MKGRWFTLSLITIVLCLSALLHGYNMFHFPYYDNDEGSYMSQAWSLVNAGKLAPYTYWYDHAPAGWMLIGAWSILTGGFYTFGFSLNSGRVLMLVLQVCSTLFVFVIAKRLTKSNFAATVAALIFACTPLGIFFHRRVLLDNIMTFWVLLSYMLLLVPKLQLKHIMLSAICFGIGVLSKENAIFFIPGFLLTIGIVSHVYHRHFALAKWIVIVGSLVSLYFLFALLKGEFFAYGSVLGGVHPHVSLIETLKFQASRQGGSFFDLQSLFWRLSRSWFVQDPLIILGGIIANLFVLLLGIFDKKKRSYLALGLCGLFSWYFLARGGIVIEFYILPLLPFHAICISVAVFEILGTLPSVIGRRGYQSAAALFLFFIVGWYIAFAQTSRAFPQNNTGHQIFTSKQTDAQMQAVNWVRKNVDPESTIVVDNYMYIDLIDSHNPSGISFPKTQWYWKVDQDPEVHAKAFPNGAEDIDYIAMTPQMNGDLKLDSSQTTLKAVETSHINASFESDGWSVLLLSPTQEPQILSRAWNSYAHTFVKIDGRTIDPGTHDSTTSEGQSYSMLRAVWEDDQKSFASVWKWTKENLENSDHLFAWKWGQRSDGSMGKIDEGSASDADEDIALALLLASKRWKVPEYQDEALPLIDAIWNLEVKEMSGTYYLVAGNWAKGNASAIINPSYLSPASYRLFAKVSPHDWSALVTDSYTVLNQCTQSSLGFEKPQFIPPEWCEINPDGSVARPATTGEDTTIFGYNAVRVPFRLALDYQWNTELKAKAYLEKFSTLREQYKKDGAIAMLYTHEGNKKEQYESLVGYAALLDNLVITDRSLATDVYEKKISPKFIEDAKGSYWEDPKNYYTNNIVWFATALYSGRLENYFK